MTSHQPAPVEYPDRQTWEPCEVTGLGWYNVLKIILNKNEKSYLSRLERMQHYCTRITLISFIYLSQKPDFYCIYHCICSNHDSLSFYAEIQVIFKAFVASPYFHSTVVQQNFKQYFTRFCVLIQKHQSFNVCTDFAPLPPIFCVL